MLFFASLGLGASAFAGADPIDPVVHLLSSRDPIACATIEAATSTPVDTLRAVVQTVSMPPWVPMRAAQCLIEGHPTEVKADLEKWVVDPQLQGLGRLVLDELDTMPADLALDLAKTALARGPDRDVAVSRIGRASSPQLRALVQK